MPLRRAQRRAALVAIALFALALQAVLVVACTDGTTPDCSDPATPCGPLLSSDVVDGSTRSPEASADSTVADGSDASDGDLDASDEG
ncbi:hypothetical protein [Labilithrix luteola]|nr:hypothetical protein [Labilithrix luteola]